MSLEIRILVVLTGCAHSGVVNTVESAKDISRVDTVLGVIGGFHLAHASDEDIQNTIDYMRLHPLQLIIPCHCTGFPAIRQIAPRCRMNLLKAW